MAITTVKQKNNTLGMLGTLAAIGGMATGQPWLSALGTGMRGINAMMNGDSNMETGEKTDEAFNKVLDKLKNIWKNPADNNIAKTDQQNTVEKAQDILGQTGTGTGFKWPSPNGRSPIDYGYGLTGPKGCVVPPYYWDTNNPWGW